MEWINVKDRLPICTKDVIVLIDTKRKNNRYIVDFASFYFYGKGKKGRDGLPPQWAEYNRRLKPYITWPIKWTVTKWMPLPKTP